MEMTRIQQEYLNDAFTDIITTDELHQKYAGFEDILSILLEEGSVAFPDDNGDITARFSEFEFLRKSETDGLIKEFFFDKEAFLKSGKFHQYIERRIVYMKTDNASWQELIDENNEEIVELEKFLPYKEKEE